MKVIMKIFCVLCLLALNLIACQPESPTGQLLVKAPSDGTYEIYRIAGEAPLQFVAEEIGHFNQLIELPVGNYLILADCSHEMIVLNPFEHKELTSHKVEFLLPHKKMPGDKFSIQCNRFTKTKSIQHIQNRFSLNVLQGQRELLVGMVPLRINFKSSEEDSKPQILTYQLSAIQLASYPSMSPKNLFFVSPANDLISITENQEFGNWLYLLAGDYVVSVNGTASHVTLKENESLKINPAFIRVSTDRSINLEISSNVLGTPLYVELNDQHWLDLNETYPVLPGVARLKLNGSFKSKEVNLVANKILDESVRSVHVGLDCSPWDWDCLGQRKVYLFEKDQLYPFAEGLTDVPILFFEDKDVWVSVEGSRDVHYQLSDKKKHFFLNVGHITLIPRHSYRPGQITDLVRIESIGKPFKGVTLDLPLDREITIPLIEGRFYLSQYTSNYSQEYERRSHQRIINMRAKDRKTIKYTVFVSEKKLKSLKKNKLTGNEQKKSPVAKAQNQALETILPVDVH